jgi:hypothetical protein
MLEADSGSGQEPCGPIRGRDHCHLFGWRLAAQDLSQLVVDDFEVSRIDTAPHCYVYLALAIVLIVKLYHRSVAKCDAAHAWAASGLVGQRARPERSAKCKYGSRWQSKKCAALGFQIGRFDLIIIHS